MNFSPIKKEILVVAVAWIAIYASTPLYMYYTLVSIGVDFEWKEVFNLWSYLTAFLVLFMLNHFLLVPKLIGKKRIWQYVVCVTIMVVIFLAFMKIKAYRQMYREREISTEMMQSRRQMPREERPELDMGERPEMIPDNRYDRRPEDRPEVTRQDEPQRRQGFKPMLLAPPDMARLLIALMMIGVDLGVIAWFNEQKMRQRLLLLEQQNLKQELQHLRYQINPHFFMNTLNNIHVLVDLDQERAKRSIVELSGLMRYALYEGNGNIVPLNHEVEFLRLYISLMKLRFSNKVEVTCDMPENAPAEAMMPPMLLATFVENAFKHGISYQEQSFIKVKMILEDGNKQMRFICINSKHNAASPTQDGHHGIGLDNVRKRLDLQYADNYKLTIDNSEEKTFAVELVLPLKKDMI